MTNLHRLSALTSLALLAACQGASSESAGPVERIGDPTPERALHGGDDPSAAPDIAVRERSRAELALDARPAGAAGFSGQQDAPVAPDREERPELDDPRTDELIEGALAGTAWDVFRDNATQVAEEGSLYYLVEWDIVIHTEDELRAYYDAGRGDVDKGVVFLLPGSTVDDVWQGVDRLHLRYCVDTNPMTGFAASNSQVSAETIIAAMDEAARAWERVANVRFEYDPAGNGNCGLNAAVPDTTYFKVARSDALPTVIAFAPSGQTAPALDGRTIGVPSQYINSQAPPGFTWPGTMMHELGHVLGFAHEHFHSNGGDCVSPSPVRDVTPEVDLISIMGYPAGNPACALTTPNLTALSPLDGYTARSFYGSPPAWYALWEQPMVE